MGTWNVNLNGNDTFLDIYDNFYSLYNQGEDPVTVSQKILTTYADYFDDEEDRNNSLFALALAQWETKVTDPVVFNQVKEIIENGHDLTLWKEFGADDKTIAKRKVVLNDFLTKISTPKEKAKRRAARRHEFIHLELWQIIEFDKENDPAIWTMVGASSDVVKIRQNVINKYLHQIVEERKNQPGRSKLTWLTIFLNLVKLTAPDNKKFIYVFEQYDETKYVHSGSSISWNGRGGGSVFYYHEQGQIFNINWPDSQTLEVRHSKDLIFDPLKKDEEFYFSGDGGKVIYIPV